MSENPRQDSEFWMIIGIGVDLLRLTRLKDVFSRRPNAITAFKRRILSKEELDDWNAALTLFYNRGEHVPLETSLEILRFLAIRCLNKVLYTLILSDGR